VLSKAKDSQEVKELLDDLFSSLGYAAQHMPCIEQISYDASGVDSSIFLLSVNPQTRGAAAFWRLRMDYHPGEKVARALGFLSGDISPGVPDPDFHFVLIPRVPAVSPLQQTRD
jgi:hypothetical protein